jgi:hypothetical protein
VDTRKPPKGVHPDSPFFHSSSMTCVAHLFTTHLLGGGADPLYMPVLRTIHFSVQVSDLKIFLLLLALPHLRSLHHQAFKPLGSAAKQPLINPPRTARLHFLGGAGLGCPPPPPSAARLSCSTQHGLESSLTALSTPSFLQISALALTATATNALRGLTLWTLRTENYE